MIEPTIGRVVWVYGRGWDEDENDVVIPPDAKPEAATVADCWQRTDGSWYLNVGGHDNEGEHFAETHVPLLQEFPTTAVPLPFATWMPYQKGQAAKTEALEKQIGSGG